MKASTDEKFIHRLQDRLLSCSSTGASACTEWSRLREGVAFGDLPSIGFWLQTPLLRAVVRQCQPAATNIRVRIGGVSEPGKVLHEVPATPAPVPVLIITGPLGVGKTTVLDEVADRLRAAGAAFAAVDLDALSWAYPPAPGDDQYRSSLMFRNLASVWANFRDAGAERLVCARVIESRDELDRYRAAIPGAVITVARLQATDESLQARLAHRLARRDIVAGEDQENHRVRRERRAVRSRELAEMMDRKAFEDVLVSTDGRDVGAVARDVLLGAGWPGV